MERRRATGVQWGRWGKAFVRRHWQALLRLRGRLEVSEEVVHLALAGGIGFLGGLGNLMFHFGSQGLKHLILGGDGDWVALAGRLPWWQRLLWPAGGGMVAGLVLCWGGKFVGLPGSSNLLEAVVVGDGKLRLRTALLKGLSSLLSISTGGSIGREGAVTHLSAALASKCGQLARWEPYRLRLLVACGAAAGISAAYNAPLAGAVFAAQIVLGNFSMGVFAPLVMASVVAAMVSRTFFGLGPWYVVPADVQFSDPWQLPWFLVLGVACGGMGALFLGGLRHAGRLFGRIHGPSFLRMSVGGSIVGLLAIEFPQVWGNGYGPANDILHGQYVAGFLAGMLLAKFLATLMTVGSGAVGGVFTPTLFLGAGVGALFGQLLQDQGLGGDLPAAAFALVGMGGVLAATTHSPLLAMLVVFEISLNYSLMPPLMVGCAVATLTARGLYRLSVYTDPLSQRGIDVDRESPVPGWATQRTVGDMMRSPVPPVRQDTPFPQIADRFLTSPNSNLPVVDARNRLVGLVALHDLKRYLGAGEELDAVIAYDIMRPPPPCLTPDQKLEEAMAALLASELRNVPVVNTRRERKLVGAVSRAEALQLLSEAMAHPARPRN